MSNFLAIATVTATLSRLLQAAVGADVPGATVTTIRPDDPAGDPTPATANRPEDAMRAYRAFIRDGLVSPGHGPVPGTDTEV